MEVLSFWFGMEQKWVYRMKSKRKSPWLWSGGVAYKANLLMGIQFKSQMWEIKSEMFEAPIVKAEDSDLTLQSYPQGQQQMNLFSLPFKRRPPTTLWVWAVSWEGGNSLGDVNIFPLKDVALVNKLKWTLHFVSFCLPLFQESVSVFLQSSAGGVGAHLSLTIASVHYQESYLLSKSPLILQGCRQERMILLPLKWL